MLVVQQNCQRSVHLPGALRRPLIERSQIACFDVRNQCKVERKPRLNTSCGSNTLARAACSSMLSQEGRLSIILSGRSALAKSYSARRSQCLIGVSRQMWCHTHARSPPLLALDLFSSALLSKMPYLQEACSHDSTCRRTMSRWKWGSDLGKPGRRESLAEKWAWQK